MTPTDRRRESKRLVTVCSACHRACCWQGEFMCDDARNASTVQMTVRELIKGQYGEHPDYWKERK